MDAELKAKWVAALRSGEYDQGRIQLFNAMANKYCCLGVLARVADWPLETPEDSDDAYKKFPLVGLDSTYQLEAMNDSFDKTFSEIADYIEQNL